MYIYNLYINTLKIGGMKYITVTTVGKVLPLNILNSIGGKTTITILCHQ